MLPSNHHTPLLKDFGQAMCLCHNCKPWADIDTLLLQLLLELLGGLCQMSICDTPNVASLHHCWMPIPIVCWIIYNYKHPISGIYIYVYCICVVSSGDDVRSVGKTGANLQVPNFG